MEMICNGCKSLVQGRKTAPHDNLVRTGDLAVQGKATFLCTACHSSLQVTLGESEVQWERVKPD